MGGVRKDGRIQKKKMRKHFILVNSPKCMGPTEINIPEVFWLHGQFSQFSFNKCVSTAFYVLGTVLNVLQLVV